MPFESVSLSAAPLNFLSNIHQWREVEVEPGCGRRSPQAKSPAQARELTKAPTIHPLRRECRLNLSPWAERLLTFCPTSINGA